MVTSRIALRSYKWHSVDATCITFPDPNGYSTSKETLSANK